MEDALTANWTFILLKRSLYFPSTMFVNNTVTGFVNPDETSVYFDDTILDFIRPKISVCVSPRGQLFKLLGGPKRSSCGAV